MAREVSTKVLSIGSDRKLFDIASAVSKRAAAYGKSFKELHIVVFTPRGYSPRRIVENVWVYPTNSASRLLYIFDAVRVGRRIARERDMGKDSVITVQDPFESGIVGALIKKRGMVMVAQAHTDFLSPFFLKGSMLNPLRLLIARFVIPRSDRIRVVSKRIKESIVAKYSYSAENIIVLPIHVDLEAYANGDRKYLKEKYPQFSFIALVLSRITKEKDIGTALEAFAAVVKEFPSAGLVIVGDGPEKGRLTDLVRMLGIERSVVFENWDSDTAKYYRSSDVFILTSLYEGYGMTLVEAAAAGCPIVSSDVGVASELIENGSNSYICPVRDVRCFKDGLSILADNQLKRNEFSLKLREKVQSMVGTEAEYVLKYALLLEFSGK